MVICYILLKLTVRTLKLGARLVALTSRAPSLRVLTVVLVSIQSETVGGLVICEAMAVDVPYG